MKKALLMIAGVYLSGCAYTVESAKALNTWELCQVIYDRGSISGIPEQNAAEALNERGGDCRDYLAARANRPAPIYIPPRPISCTSTTASGTTHTQCF